MVVFKGLVLPLTKVQYQMMFFVRLFTLPSLVPRLSPHVNKTATKSWAGPGNEATPSLTLVFLTCDLA